MPQPAASSAANTIMLAVWRKGTTLAYATCMTNSIHFALTNVASQAALERTSNVLSNTFRELGQLIDGHEKLVLVIFGMLVLIYLYIRKA